MEKAFASLGDVPDRSILQMLALRVSADFMPKVDGIHFLTSCGFRTLEIGFCQ